MNIHFGEAMTKYHGERKKIAVVHLPGKGHIELALSDTARCARMPDAARRTIVNLAGEDAFRDEGEIAAAADALHRHCRVLMGLKDEAR